VLGTLDVKNTRTNTGTHI